LIDVERLRHEEATEWSRLERAFARVDPRRFEEPTLTPAGWSPRDLMFHVAGWLEECARVLGNIRSGTIDPIRGEAGSRPGRIERVNADLFERSRQMDAASVRRSFRDARTRALAAFGSLDEITPEAWEWFDESGPRHYREHARDVDAWLDR
jgi:hypothetical protein